VVCNDDVSKLLCFSPFLQRNPESAGKGSLKAYPLQDDSSLAPKLIISNVPSTNPVDSLHEIVIDTRCIAISILLLPSRGSCR